MLRDASLIVLVSLMVGALIASLFLNKHLGDDNVVEEVIEQVIEDNTGVDIDLTPASEEAYKSSRDAPRRSTR